MERYCFIYLKFFIEIKYALIFCILIGLLTSSIAKASTSNTILDSIAYNSRSFDTAAVYGYAKKDKAFVYQTERQSAKPSLLAKMLNDVLSTFFKASDSIPSKAWRILKWLTIVLGVIFVIFKVFKLPITGIFSYKSNKFTDLNPKVTTNTLKDIQNINFDNLVKSAEDNKDFRLAIRSLFLKALHNLHENQHIVWSIDKTNANYATELVNTSLHKAFLQLSTVFDYVWYGHLPINEIQYWQYKQQFDKFNLQIEDHVATVEQNTNTRTVYTDKKSALQV